MFHGAARFTWGAAAALARAVATGARSDLIHQDADGLSSWHWMPGQCLDNSAAIRAAAKSNPHILRTIIKHGNKIYDATEISEPPRPLNLATENEYGPNSMNYPFYPTYNSALVQAYVSNLLENVATLITAGAILAGQDVQLMVF